MPFKNVKQEMAMKINAPKVWATWVSKYGHASGYSAAMKKNSAKAKRTRKKSNRRR